MNITNISRRNFIRRTATSAAALALSPEVFSFAAGRQPAQPLVFCGSENNDLFRVLTAGNIPVQRYEQAGQAIRQAAGKSGVLLTASGYPDRRVAMPQALYDLAAEKRLRLYVEYPDHVQGHALAAAPIVGTFERGVVTSGFFGSRLAPMSLLSLHDCRLYPVDVSKTHIVFARVAGFDRAVYGLTDTDVWPLLFSEGNVMTAMTCLSSFCRNRFGPVDAWQTVWQRILAWLLRTDVTVNHWPADPHPAYTATETLPAGARSASVEKGCEWYFKGRFFVHPSWMDHWLKYQGDGAMPVGPPVGEDCMVGDGSLGVLEGHASNIRFDGTQQYRYWMRADVQGETAFALAAGALLSGNGKYRAVAEKLIDYLFYTSKFRQGLRRDRNSPVYGYLGWADTQPATFYGDDNARAILGVIGAAACLGSERWNHLIVENILANFRMCSRQGFQERRMEEADILEKGRSYYADRDYFNPNNESWLWACYLWLYAQTGHAPLLEKTKSAIRLTMEHSKDTDPAHPQAWFQPERARMVLCLAWLVRVDDTPQHREWLDIVVRNLLAFQQPNGAIREVIGNSEDIAHTTRSNREYGVNEALLIEADGDPVADMLYANNFAFFGLNEAAHVTGRPEYRQAVERLSDFLTRIQVRSERHPDLDGAWFRAFDYRRWEYWASNADVGWGAWATLTGWIQAWITGTQMLLEQGASFWELAGKIRVKEPIGTLES
ncbi:MAG: twin-arginine translocation signal domain-containing protein [Tannerella sp.]|jgi:hypothetical protein|nr:twin-arginine translocation signal domain-containing protein [Tannerella sp.]